MKFRNILIGFGVSIIPVLSICGACSICQYAPIFFPPDRDLPQLSENDQKFFDDVQDMMKNVGLDALDESWDESAPTIDKVQEFEKYLEGKESHIFESGAVFRAGSSFHIFALTAYIRAYDLSGDCEKVHELLPEFITMINDDYLAVNILTGEVFDPDLNNDNYNNYEMNKISEDVFLIKYLSDLKCNSSEIRSHRYWRLDESISPDKSEELNSEKPGFE